MLRAISRRAFLRASSFALLVPSLPLALLPKPANSSITATRKRLRELGIVIGHVPTGRWNAITDVPDVSVGHCSLVEGNGAHAARTGVTVVFPNGNVFRENVAAAQFILNGNGEMTGVGQIDFAGLLDSPIFLTDTSNIGRVLNGAVSWFLETCPEIGETAPMPVPVVAETWAGFLHDSPGRYLRDEHVFNAVSNARSGPVLEGAVGGGVGMVCYGFKGGIGTSSRLLPQNCGGYTIGVLVQANHGKREQLMISGVPVGREIRDRLPRRPNKGKSIILIGATNAPMLPAQLRRLCKRMTIGLARTGAVSTHGSGDLLLFFSTGLTVPRDARVANFEIFNDEWITFAHQAAMEAAEEAVLNALCMAETTTGVGGNTAYALPIERLPDIMRKYGFEPR